MKVFKIKTNDRVPSIELELSPASDDITSLPVVFNLRNRETGLTKVARGTAVITNPTNPPRVRYDWAAGDTDTDGLYDAEVEVMFPGNKPGTYPSHEDDNIVVIISQDIA